MRGSCEAHAEGPLLATQEDEGLAVYFVLEGDQAAHVCRRDPLGPGAHYVFFTHLTH